MNEGAIETISRDTVERIVAQARDLLVNPRGTRAIALGSGLQGYNLQAPAKQLVALMSNFYKSIPREVKEGANSDNWRQIISLGSPDPFSTEALGGNRWPMTVQSVTKPFFVTALQGYVTLEEQKASGGFDPALAKETANSMLLAMKLQEQAFFGGNTVAFGNITSGVTVALSTSAGNITAGATTYFVRIAALTLLAANRAPLSFPNDVNANSESLLAPPGITQAQLQAITGYGQPTATTVITTGPQTAFQTGCGMTAPNTEFNSGSVTPTNKALKITWNAVPGAVAYAVWVGTTTGLANLGLQCIVTQTQVCLTSLVAVGASAVAGSDAAVPTSDQSANSQHSDGILSQLLNAGTGSGSLSSPLTNAGLAGYTKNLGATLTGSNNEILEVQDMFANLFATAKIGAFRLVVGGNDQRILTRLGIKTGAMTIFVSPQLAGRQDIVAGGKVGEIVNAVTGDPVPIELNEWLPPGTILCLPTKIPYPMANLTAPFKWVGNYDWTRWDYGTLPTTGPIYNFDVRANGVLESQFPGGCGILYNIWKG